MICKYCGDITTYAPMSPDDGAFRYVKLEIYYCHKCLAEYVFLKKFKIDNKNLLWSHSIYIFIKNKLYKWTNPILGGGHIWFIEHPGIPGVKKNKGLKLLKSFKQDCPEITPKNIEEKFKAWLAFI